MKTRSREGLQTQFDRCFHTGGNLEADTQIGRTPRENEGEGQDDESTSQGCQQTTTSWGKPGTMSPAEPQKEPTLQTLHVGLPASSVLGDDTFLLFKH